MNKVLWNNEMTLAIGLVTEMDQDEFLQYAMESHQTLTGYELFEEEGTISKNNMIYMLEVV